MPKNLYEHLAEPRPPLEMPHRVLAVGAHPDDVEFGAGATIARWAAAGAEVTLAVVTDGSKGTWDSSADPRAVAARRRAEAEQAATLLGAKAITFLDHVDGELEYSMQLRAEMALLVRQYEPDIVLSHDPWQRYQLHPDHRVTGMAVVDGVVAARDPLFFPDQGLRAHRPGALLLWSADQPDHIEPADPEMIHRKIAALLCHVSQAETTMGDAHRDPAARDAFAARVTAWAEEQGVPFGAGAAETFKRITP